MQHELGVLVIVFLALLVVPSGATAQERTTQLKQAESIRCVFEGGHGFEWRDGEFVGARKENEDHPVVFDRIDREGGHARQVYNTPTVSSRIDDVTVVEFEWRLPRESSSTYGLTFVVVDEYDGGISVAHGQWVGMTTVWSPADPPADSSTYPAVFSHHMALAAPFPSQFPGSCRIQS
jgi:hypothetical protein